MILIKDRHGKAKYFRIIIKKKGNMILIKDRHLPLIVTTFPTSIIGKYDTYKGSTLSLFDRIQVLYHREI